MANRRTLHKKISLCEQLADVSDLAKLAYTWGILHADDWGVIKASPRSFKAEVLPLHDAPPSEVGTALDELVSVRLVVRYNVGGVPHLWFPTFDAYQDGLHKRTERNRLPMPMDADPGTIENEKLARQLFPEPEAEPDALPGTSGKSPESAGISGLARAGGNETKGNEQNNDLLPESADGALPAPAIDPPPADPPAAKQTRKPRVETPEQAAIHRLWDAFELPDKPTPAKGEKPGYSSVLKLLQEHGIPLFDELAAHVTDDPTARLPDGAKPWPWFCKQARAYLSAPWKWQAEQGAKPGANGRASPQPPLTFHDREILALLGKPEEANAGAVPD